MAFDPLTAISDLIGKAISFIPNPAEREKAEREMRAEAMSMAQQLTIAQIEVNKVEAASSSVFVAGWRPLVGWAGGFAVVWSYVVAPVATWVMQVAGVSTPPLPVLDSTMAQLLFGLLGVGFAARTVEKVQGVAGPLARK